MRSDSNLLPGTYPTKYGTIERFSFPLELLSADKVAEFAIDSNALKNVSITFSGDMTALKRFSDAVRGQQKKKRKNEKPSVLKFSLDDFHLVLIDEGIFGQLYQYRTNPIPLTTTNENYSQLQNCLNEKKFLKLLKEITGPKAEGLVKTVKTETEKISNAVNRVLKKSKKLPEGLRQELLAPLVKSAQEIMSFSNKRPLGETETNEASISTYSKVPKLLGCDSPNAAVERGFHAVSSHSPINNLPGSVTQASNLNENKQNSRPINDLITESTEDGVLYLVRNSEI